MDGLGDEEKGGWLEKGDWWKPRGIEELCAGGELSLKKSSVWKIGEGRGTKLEGCDENGRWKEG